MRLLCNPSRQRPLLLIILLAMLSTACGDLIEIRPLRPLDLDRARRPTTIVDAEGGTLAELRGAGLGHPVGLEQVAPVLIDAVIAVEDARFRQHHGIDVRALGRALVRNIRSSRIVEGGSTITQQLAKNSATGSARTIERKLAEASIAWQLEQVLSKDEILERYLNTVYFGNGAYGIEAAAREYFDQPADRLDLPQAALLAGLLRSPASYDPRRHPDAATRRRDVVVGLMREQGTISARQALAATSRPVAVSRPGRRPWRAAYFVDHVLEVLQHDPDFAFLGDTAQARAARVFAGDLRIETTLDPTWQRAAKDAITATLPHDDDPDGALVAIDPASGAVRALVGGRDFFGDDDAARFNLATDARRQPGSTFKPIVLATALRDGHSLDDRYPAPAQLRLPAADGEPEAWTVANYGDASFGTLDLRTATTYSVNVVFAQLVDQIGADLVAELAADLGVRSRLQPFRSLALGAQEVTVMDMASVQATLAAGGVHRPPVVVDRITGSGGATLYRRGRPRGHRVLDQSTALQVTAALRDVVTSGTGVRADARRPLAGKTGTTQDGADAWFAGYTPDMAASVWMGFHDGRVPMTPPRTRITVEGGTWPAEAFARFTMAALDDVPANDFSVRVPDLRSAPAAQAERRLERAGFAVSVVDRYSPSLPPGIVLEQQPPPGDDVALPVGYRAELVVSTGTPTTVTVPDVLAEDVDEAAGSIRDIGLVPQVDRRCPGGTPTCTGAVERPGQVWEQVPPAGVQADSGDRILLRSFPRPS